MARTAEAIVVREVVSVLEPNAAGRELADYVFSYLVADAQVVLDLRSLPPALVIRGFFNSFLQRSYDHDPNLLVAARCVDWIHQFPFHKEMAAATVAGFKPRD